MSRGSSGGQSTGPLGVGNVITAALRLYRDNFKVYFLIALKAYAWVLVPIYGWAKYAVLLGLIARLAYSQVREQPETVSEAQRDIEPRKWTFLLTGILISLIIIGATLGVGIVAAIIIGLITVALGTSGAIISGVVGLIFLLILLYGLLWISARYSVADMAIAIEEESGSLRAINRSLALTQGYWRQIILIFFVASLVSLPISIALQVADTIVTAIFASIATDQTVSLVYLLNLTLSLAAGAFLAPFWQSIKAVIYYDLRNRKEGLDLQDRLI